jgi:hypothetical protein
MIYIVRYLVLQWSRIDKFDRHMKILKYNFDTIEHKLHCQDADGAHAFDDNVSGSFRMDYRLGD